jgi:hypothetical protein
MQRRTGKAVAHISPPLSSSRMGFDVSEKPSSRLNQKSFGVTNKIWLIVVLFLALIFLTRSILPADSASYPRHKFLNTDAKPRNYLNISEGDSVPFSFCPALGPGDELATKYDPVALTKTRLHTGSGARIQRVITRALSGLPVTISVIGGSGKSVHASCIPSWHLFSIISCLRHVIWTVALDSCRSTGMQLYRRGYLTLPTKYCTGGGPSYR